jgi:hypothetical protein
MIWSLFLLLIETQIKSRILGNAILLYFPTLLLDMVLILALPITNMEIAFNIAYLLVMLIYIVLSINRQVKYLQIIISPNGIEGPSNSSKDKSPIFIPKTMLNKEKSNNQNYFERLLKISKICQKNDYYILIINNYYSDENIRKIKSFIE